MTTHSTISVEPCQSASWSSASPKFGETGDMPNRIRELREARGWSLEALARRIGTSNQQVSRLELGRTRLTTDWMQRFSEAFGVDPAELLNRKRAPSAQRPIGFSEGEAAEYKPADNERPQIEALCAGLGRGLPNAHLWELRSTALNLAGYLPGDLLMVDLDTTEPPAGAIVCAQVYDWSSGRAETVFRLWDPPFLLTRSMDMRFGKPIIVDHEKVIIKGTVIGCARLL